MDYLTFGNMLEDVLHYKKMERRQLAELMEVHPSNVSRYIKLDKATNYLNNRVSSALQIDIWTTDQGYIWVDKLAKVEALAQSNESIRLYTTQSNEHLEKAKALVKKRLHDAIVEACMKTPEKYRPEVFKYFLQYQDSSQL
jgi:exosome complex RNA-binding protein Rrp4